MKITLKTTSNKVSPGGICGKSGLNMKIEPKRTQLLNQDQWKQELLESIRPENIELVGENDQVKLYGVKFFTYNDGRNVEQEIENLP